MIAVINLLDYIYFILLYYITYITFP